MADRYEQFHKIKEEMEDLGIIDISFSCAPKIEDYKNVIEFAKEFDEEYSEEFLDKIITSGTTYKI